MIRPLYRLVALCLALSWGPATLCCALEAAGWDLMCSSPDCHDSSSGEATADGCTLVEDGNYHAASASITAMPPVATPGACLGGGGERDPAPVDAAYFSAPARPCDWVPSWQFERRAAAPAHAPDSLIA